MGDSIKVVHSILGHHWLRISKDNNAMMKGIFPPEYPIGRVRATAPPLMSLREGGMRQTHATAVEVSH